ncbi:GNAT family N-acetyltransferase [Paraburkholderia mimosarum]|uniref:GNAT family N-acetyltransferase n=1 Tax=Paraburkholderia mimosarum TaxID=312026 RepID=UPI0039C2E8E2
MLDVPATRNIRRTHALDDAIWGALTGRHRQFAVGDRRVLRYAPAVAPFAAMADTTPESFEALRRLIAEHEPVALTTLDALDPPDGFVVIRHAALLQMVWEGHPVGATSLEHVRLEARDVPEMMALTAVTEPGPFGPRTIELGDYLGVRKNGKLVAMAGERIKIDGHTEISAVCVDPAFRGQGLAAGLIRLLIAAICARGETPFLHVLTSNHGAVSIYREMGFVERREMHLTVLGIAQP